MSHDGLVLGRLGARFDAGAAEVVGGEEAGQRPESIAQIPWRFGPIVNFATYLAIARVAVRAMNFKPIHLDAQTAKPKQAVRTSPRFVIQITEKWIRSQTVTNH